MEPPHDRIAKRRAEIDDELAALDREDAERRAADSDVAAEVVDHRKGGAVRSTVFLVLLVVVVAGLFGLAITLSRLAGNDFADAQRQGRAQVSRCSQHGPITNKGFGYWDRCTATIAWDDGTTDRITADAVFKSADIGTDVRVADLGKYRQAQELARADAPHRPWLAWIGYLVGAIAFVPGLILTLIVRELVRFRRR
jgi:hypothetical protein